MRFGCASVGERARVHPWYRSGAEILCARYARGSGGTIGPQVGNLPYRVYFLPSQDLVLFGRGLSWVRSRGSDPPPRRVVPKKKTSPVNEAVFSHARRCCVRVISYLARLCSRSSTLCQILSLLPDEQATKMMQFPFTFTLSIPGLHNPFLANPGPVLAQSRIQGGTTSREIALPLPRLPHPNSLSPPAPIFRKRGWIPSEPEPSHAATFAASTTGYLDTPAKYRDMPLRDPEQEAEEMIAGPSSSSCAHNPPVTSPCM